MATNNTTSKLIGISSFRLVGPDQHAEYEVTINGIPCCWHRYREFDELNTSLQKLGFQVKVPFPPKRIFSGNTPRVIAERKTGIEVWLRAIVEQAATNNKTSKTGAIMREFLKKDPWDDIPHTISGSTYSGGGGGGGGASSQSHLINNKTESKLHDIVNRFATAASSPNNSFPILSSNSKLNIQEVEEEEFNMQIFKAKLEQSENIFKLLKPVART